MGKRADGEGSIYKLKNGKFAAMLTIGYVQGKRKRKKFEGKTRKEVAEKLTVARRQQDAHIDLSAPIQPLSVFLVRWFEDISTPSTDRPKTISTYQQVITLHLVPELGDILVQKLTTIQVQQFITTLGKRISRRNEPYAASTVKLARTVLRQAVQQAVDWKMIAYNPVIGVKTPRVQRRADRQMLTVDEARALIEAIQGDRLACAIRLGLMLGMRRGEICGLHWIDVDVDSGVIHIRRNGQYIQGYGLVCGEPKSDNGRRSIKLPALLLAELRWHKERQKAERAAMGERWQDSDFVFVAATTGGMLNPNTLTDAFKRGLKRAGLPETIRFHDLRHGCASFLIAQNVHPKVISMILGHANIQITMNLYGHLLPGALDDAAGQVEALLSEKPSGGNASGNTGTYQ